MRKPPHFVLVARRLAALREAREWSQRNNCQGNRKKISQTAGVTFAPARPPAMLPVGDAPASPTPLTNGEENSGAPRTRVAAHETPAASASQISSAGGTRGSTLGGSSGASPHLSFPAGNDTGTQPEGASTKARKAASSSPPEIFHRNPALNHES